MTKHVQVSVSLNIFDVLTYGVQETEDKGLFKSDSQDQPNYKKITRGLRVLVPVRNRLTPGWIMNSDIEESGYKGRVKNIVGIIRDGFTPDQMYMNFIESISNLYLTSAGMLLDSALPPKLKSINSLYFKKDGVNEKVKNYTLNDLQKIAKTNPIEFFFKDNIEIPENELESKSGPGYSHEFFLGYSRIDHYRKIIDECLAANKTVLVVVPDNLTASYLKEALGNIENVTIYNSDLKPKERELIWNDCALKGKPGVIIGGISAVFLPIRNLGAVICDRSGSSTYKRSFYSAYHIDVIARLRAKAFNVPLIEGFSTYTVGAFMNRETIKVEDVRNEKNINAVEVHSILPRAKGIPEEFFELLQRLCEENKKILIILNRKESFNFLFCPKCKKLVRCPKCNGSIDVGDEFNVKCRRCGYEARELTHCPTCNEELVIVEDISIASIVKAVKRQIMEKGVMSLSAEGLGDEHIHQVLKRIMDSRVVVSTPVIINPYFTGIFDAVIYFRPESLFNLDEYDAAEKIFSIISEFKEMVKADGTIDVFSTFHFHYSLKSINDENHFFERELKYREWFQLPPFSNVYQIEVKGNGLRELAAEMRKIYAEFKDRLNIKCARLVSRNAYRGTYKGIIEAHILPEMIIESGLLSMRDISIELMMV